MQSELTRPIVGIESRTAQEVFDIMCDRFKIAMSAAEPQTAPSVAVKALADAYKAGFDASSQGYNGEVFPEYEADNEWLAQRDSDLSALSAQVQDVAGNPIGYMRKQDNDGNSFWVHRVQNAYYSEPVYAAAPAKQEG